MKKLIKLLMFIVVILIIINVYVYINLDSEYTLNKNLISQISSNTDSYIDEDKISQELKNSVISIEDKRFYKHFGFDIIGIIRATLKNIKEDKYAEGGSTITQQLAKNLFLNKEKSLDRKLKELVLAIDLEILYSKDEILEMYLNVIYYGQGAYGIKDASEVYFDKEAKDLSLSESAMLAGILSAPSIYNPKTNPSLAKKRQELVITLMNENDMITTKTMNEIIN